MATEIRVPTLGESVSEATVGKWFKKAGEAITADEPIVELETDKVTVEVPAPAAGTLAEITVQEGETVEVGALLGSISAGDAPAKKEDKPKADDKPAKEEKKAEAAPAKSDGASKSGDMPPLLSGQLARDALVLCFKECESVKTGKPAADSGGGGRSRRAYALATAYIKT